MLHRSNGDIGRCHINVKGNFVHRNIDTDTAAGRVHVHENRRLAAVPGGMQASCVNSFNQRDFITNFGWTGTAHRG
jgi:hypothetical protein